MWNTNDMSVDSILFISLLNPVDNCIIYFLVCVIDMSHLAFMSSFPVFYFLFFWRKLIIFLLFQPPFNNSQEGLDTVN